jgi:hypothetical protein
MRWKTIRKTCQILAGLVFAGLTVAGLGQIGSPEAGPSPAIDAAALVRRAVANHFAQQAAHQPQSFALHRRDERHNVVREIMETPQGDVAMLVAVNGAPLSATGRQAEIDRLNNLAENPDLQAHRQKREQEDQARVDNLMHLLPEAFVYHYDATVACNMGTMPNVQVPGVARAAAPPAVVSQCYHLNFSPNPHFDPPNIEAKVLKGMAGEVWIEKSDERLLRLSAQLIDDVDFGWGIVGRLDKGGTVYLEQTEVRDKDWELTRMKLSFTGKALLVKPINIRLSEEMANFAQMPANTDYKKAIEMLKAGPASK